MSHLRHVSYALQMYLQYVTLKVEHFSKTGTVTRGNMGFGHWPRFASRPEHNTKSLQVRNSPWCLAPKSAVHWRASNQDCSVILDISDLSSAMDRAPQIQGQVRFLSPSLVQHCSHRGLGFAPCHIRESEPSQLVRAAESGKLNVTMRGRGARHASSTACRAHTIRVLITHRGFSLGMVHL